MEGPVRSMSRMPTEWPARERERAVWVVMEDLPTPPLPESTWRRWLVAEHRAWDWGVRWGEMWGMLTVPGGCALRDRATLSSDAEL